MLATDLIPLAAPVIHHASEGPSAAPLIVELIAAAAIGAVFITRRPLARRLRAIRAAVTGHRRRADHRAAPSTG